MTVTSLLLLSSFRNRHPPSPPLPSHGNDPERDPNAEPHFPQQILSWETFCPKHLLCGSDDEWEPPKRKGARSVSAGRRVDTEEMEAVPQLTVDDDLVPLYPPWRAHVRPANPTNADDVPQNKQPV